MLKTCNTSFCSFSWSESSATGRIAPQIMAHFIFADRARFFLEDFSYIFSAGRRIFIVEINPLWSLK